LNTEEAFSAKLIREPKSVQPSVNVILWFFQYQQIIKIGQGSYRTTDKTGALDFKEVSKTGT
jgi:hypothetical protein